MSAAPDFYTVLGVSPDASQGEIRSAFRALVRRYHPDTRDDAKHPTSDAALRSVLTAYGILRDPELRRQYDRSLPRVQPVRIPAPRPAPVEEPEFYRPNIVYIDPYLTYPFLIRIVR